MDGYSYFRVDDGNQINTDILRVIDKTVLIWRCRLTSIGIPMIKTGGSHDRLVFIIGIPIPVKMVFILIRGTCLFYSFSSTGLDFTSQSDIYTGEGSPTLDSNRYPGQTVTKVMVIISELTSGTGLCAKARGSRKKRALGKSSSYDGSGHGTAAVLLPGFAISW